MTRAAPEPIGRFAHALTALGIDGGRLGLAVSGGPDSLALLLLAHGALPGTVMAATVDHGLRPEAAGEAAMVAAVCRDRGVPHMILPLSVVPDGRGLHAAARDARYRALGAWAVASGLAAIATAHHLDDQAETVLMRLTRGSGLAGLAGIRARRPLAEHPAVALVRPLLGWRKAELEAIVTEAGLQPVRDPANIDPRHDRTHARTALAALPALDPQRLATSAAALGEAEEALAWTTVQLLPQRWNGDTLDVAGLPREIRRRMLARLLPEARGDALTRLLARLEAGEASTLGGLCLRPAGDLWRIAPAPPRRTG